ncbi:MAG: PilZ domain-containing protein [Gammaproteobacteria bacterium]|nr:PilZ domain-containing protein [Gammaproteobacteria bacterium]MBD3776028.1 PilZ domain-containing protein [Thiotrichales bacterium]
MTEDNTALNEDSAEEKRREPRYHTYKSSVLIHENQEIYTTIIDLSASGLGLLCAIELQPGEQDDLLYNIEALSQFNEASKETAQPSMLHLPIEVVRVNEAEDEYVVGVKLRKVPEEYHAILKRVAEMQATLGIVRPQEPAEDTQI